jgi:hypothetical protein
MRDVFDELEKRGVDYFVTGSEALPRYAAPRTTLDIDVVADMSEQEFLDLSGALSPSYLAAEPIRYHDRALASLIDIRGQGKVDIIMRQSDAWGASAMQRRVRWDHPALGQIWVSSPEDLILAKLEWSEGTSELQLRDCKQMIRMNRDVLDWKYLERWAMELGLSDLLENVRASA